MTSLNEQSMDFNGSIKVNFNGGNLTNDSGLLLYKEFAEKIGLSQLIQSMVILKDPVNHDVHTNDSVIMQKIYQHIAGYHADDHADSLRYDPALTTILEKDYLASQPTMSRVNQLFDVEAMKQLQHVNDTLTERFHKLASPEDIILDLDSTNAATYGNQHGSKYNSHYGENGYHPMLMFDGLTGDCLKGELRAGSVYTSRQVVRFVGPTLKRYKTLYPWISPVIRGDSGFAVPELFELAETKEALYVIRLKANKRLYAKAEEILAQIPDDIIEKTSVFYREFTYQANSWTQPRRVVVKIERPKDELLFQFTFIVTNMNLSPKNITKLYFNRGTMENFIKEGKLGFAFGKMTSTEFERNACKLQIAILAYNLHNGFKRLCLPETKNTKLIDTVRLQLIKIAGKFVRSGRYLTFKLSSHCLYKKEFMETLSRIQMLPRFG
ncbi:IS1380 family transposase [Cytobacillus sp. S13-E01]|uniref:IS1380 family transposase n=1 Tax=Cytobacillus sp. S13-E01 TaxID=3031326 RepID=UPI0023D7B7CC|nr:IS1380 family transposase [Cytobacillus sp. S13-E01]MDF0728902.1 IS1380 family transposase [Cytobacillus sp. S13-E01]MDF0728915.1 IS1380 family transposase [Cytobacillus sp. S13-E01]MDF0728956.1 IS1380 family transposase [Cytobacillus sp. S13-E01]MDF0729108.1 IS1380 family transposase [Cytobacillus sp. S13-E01]